MQNELARDILKIMTKKSLIAKARYLRTQETKTEKLLWSKIRNRSLGVKFRRQHPIDKFVLDFYCPEIDLAIELDGSPHIENKEYDKTRTEHLGSKFIKIIRFWNSEVENDLEQVLSKIKKEIETSLRLRLPLSK